MRQLLAVFLLCLPALLPARPVSRQQAQAIAEQLMRQKGMAAPTPSPVFRAPRAGQQDTTAYFYVFNATDENGFVIVSGDDRTPQLLGYSSSGKMDANALPGDIRSFLQGYADAIRHLDGTPQATALHAPVLRSEKTTHPVSPLLTTTWDQGSPFNEACPTIEGDHAVTGCVATAMAQAMNFYKWPAQTAAAIPSYTSSQAGTVTGVAVGTAIDWDNMADSYSASATNAQKQAVANLMRYAGTAVEMDYSLSSSGAYSSDIAPALKTYFDYSCRSIDRSDYELAAFERTLYDEVAAGRPVIFSGNSTGGGHCFIIDGYDGDGLFHVNWGWGGISDGFFLLSVLNPDNTDGIGASTTSDGYSMEQAAVVGITPSASSPQPATALGMTVNNLAVDNSSHLVTFDIWNLTGETHTFDAAIATIGDDGAPETVVRELFTGQQYANYYGIPSLSASLSQPELAPGTYRMAVVSRVSGTGEWAWAPSAMFLLTIDDTGKVTLEASSSTVNLAVKKWNFPGSKTANTTQPVNITINNSGMEYYGTVYLFVSKTSSKGNYRSSTGLTAKANALTTIQMSFTPTASGDYRVWLCGDSKGSQVIGSTNVTIDAGSSTANLSLAGSSIDNSNGTNVYGKALSGTITVKNNDTSAFSGQLVLFLFDRTGSSINYLQPSLTIAAGQTASFDFRFDGLATGEPYSIGLYRYNNGYTTIGDFPWYQLRAGIVTYKSDGTSTAGAPSSSYTVPADVAAIDFTDVEGTVTLVNASNANPNALYFFATNTMAARQLSQAGGNVVVGSNAESLTLTDGYDFFSPQSFTATTATYTRQPAIGTGGTGGWQTLCLPFEASGITVDGQAQHWFTSATDGGKDLWVMEFTEINGSTVVFGYNKEPVIKASTPYIIAVPDDHWGAQYSLVGKTLSFNGTHATVEATGSVKPIAGSSVYNFVGTPAAATVTNAYTINDDGTAFILNNPAAAKPFSAYFKPRSAEETGSAKLSIGIEGDDNGASTGIVSIIPQKEEDGTPAYNLSGQRVEKSFKGIVIRNGKKFLNK